MEFSKTGVDLALLINSLHQRKSAFNKQLHKRLLRCNCLFMFLIPDCLIFHAYFIRQINFFVFCVCMLSSAD